MVPGGQSTASTAGPPNRPSPRQERSCGNVRPTEPMHHILVTNDFPPKVGGIQSYLWELWRRLPPSSFTVLTISHPDADAFDAVQAFRVVRLPARMLVPTPCLARQVRSLASKVRAGLVIFDPAIPVGLLGPRLGLPYGVVLHGAEVSIPGKLPVTSAALAKVLRCAEVAVAAGEWVGTEAARVAAAARKPRPGRRPYPLRSPQRS
jgi:phosphatidylinositol alpha-1,6-mannosyltransferase